ncbi:MAG TPA: hypothetical protein VNY24_12205, partial [Candidatus Acidoferrales bacterium]|nr:hypothetical protein [Candidatus Acidoferrales bacterium]
MICVWKAFQPWQKNLSKSFLVLTKTQTLIQHRLSRLGEERNSNEEISNGKLTAKSPGLPSVDANLAQQFE